MSVHWKNLDSKSFTERSDRWYNLSTKRFVKNPPKDETICWSLKQVRVLGTKSQVKTFWKVNSTQLETVCSGKSCSQELFQPFRDVTYMSEQASSRSSDLILGPASKMLPLPKNTDVEGLSTEQLDNLTGLHFGGLFLKARVVDVIDGDTIKVVVFFPLNELGSCRKINRKLQVSAYPAHSKKNSGFFTLLSIRTYGYDAVEKDQPAGQLAKQLFQEKLESLNNVIWCQFIDPSINKDKYDRHLAVLYEDQNKTRLLNDYLLKKQTEVKTVLVNPYLGGTKEKF